MVAAGGPGTLGSYSGTEEDKGDRGTAGATHTSCKAHPLVPRVRPRGSAHTWAPSSPASAPTKGPPPT